MLRAPSSIALFVASLALLVADPAGAQTRTHGERRASAAPHGRIGRLAVAARQGSADEVVLPVTEIRARRTAARGPRGRTVRLCLRAPVEVRRLRSRDAPRWVGSLTDCGGRPTLRAMAALALLAQPQRDISMNLPAAMNELRRVAPAAGLALADDIAPPPPRRRREAPATPAAPAAHIPRDPHTHDPIVEVARGARALHPRLIQLLQSIVEHFPGRTIEIVSGYRPGTSASRHAHARALDLRLVGVRHEALRDFARRLPGAGVGFYPNSVFIHLDVRDNDEGNAFWTDYSGPGETPRYGHWPPTDRDVQTEVGWMVQTTSALLRDGAHAATAPTAVDPAQEDREPEDITEGL